MTKVVLRVLAFPLACLGVLCAVVASSPPAAEAATGSALRSPTVTVAAGGSHTVVLRADGRLQAWGSNLYGQLGDGTTTQRLTPAWVGSDTDWVAVACGANHTVALKANGALYAWGQNLDGQLGVGDTSSRSSPTLVGFATDWVAVACGSFHTVALKGDGSLWVWGDNTNGQLGLDDTTDRTTPQTLGGANWSFVAAGGWHTLAVKTTGQLYAWGRNDYGQLGDGAGVEWHHPIRMTDATNWVAVAGGAYHSAGLRADGSLYTWGRNNYGQLGLGNTTNVDEPIRVGSANDWVGVACGSQHTLGLKADATAYGWGYNDYGQVGDASTSYRTSPTAVKSTLTFASLAAGGNHGGAVIADGSVATWGYNASGQIGDNTTTTRTSPGGVLSPGCVWAAPRAHRGEASRVSCEYDHSLAVRTEGSLYAWGDSSRGQVGDGSFVDRPSPVPVGSAFVWRSAAAGAFFSVALRHDGSLYTWGHNEYGQLGLGGVDYADKASPQRVGSANDWVAVAAGKIHVLALKANGTLWAWGMNSDGQLGIGNQAETNTPTQVGSATDWVEVAAGGYASYGIRADGSLYAWGSNGFGQLGLSDLTLRTTPTRVGAANDWAAVSGGGNHVLGLTSAGAAYAWGSNLQGQLGTGEGTFRTSPTAVSPATGWVRVSGGDFHSNGVRNDGALYSWGFNSTGQLGDSSLVDRPLPTAIGTGYTAAAGGFHHSLLTKSNGDVYATGGNESGQLGWGWHGDTAYPTRVIRLWDWVSPIITSLTSSSHPVATNWYSDATADLQWTATDDNGLYGYSRVYDTTPATPDLWVDFGPFVTGSSTPVLGDGIWYYSIRARDVGGSWSTPAVRQIRVDATAPSTVVNLRSPTHPESGWYSDDSPTFTWDAATDATSGVAGYSWECRLNSAHADQYADGTGTSVSFGPLDDGVWDFNVRAIDQAGNPGPSSYKLVRVDTHPPVTTNDADALWHRGPVSVHLSATDTVTPIIVTHYRVDGGDWLARAGGATVTLRTWKRGGKSGVHTIDYYSEDLAHNEEVLHSCQVKLDAKPPLTLCDAPAEPAPAPVTVHLTATDAHSGVSVTRYTSDPASGWLEGDFVDYASPGTYTLYYYSTDYAGNVELVRSRTFTVLAAGSPRDLAKRSLRLR